ncbi:APC family permease [Nocardiopsis suaedae]|uniref:APC family permease n=1 Tax=Nocardiopsis suaedae TaxID=3018444 RepID=A0ABT4TSG7_9ACTN|nr:APC family permease [Nocardiopsis suaedae]MDA2807630.1 APC family permease [Nocardiopsis suaedae]
MSVTGRRATAPEPGAPQRTIGFGQAVALYSGAVLGAGVLVLPGQAATMAGPASLLAWLFMGLLGLPLATTFAALATRFPDAGGIATYAARAFGPTAGGLSGWFYFASAVAGQTVVPLTGGYYVAAALGAGPWFAYPIAAVILALAAAANLAGMRLSGRAQLVLAAGVALMLLAAALAALPRVSLDGFTDPAAFAPHGVAGVAEAAVVLFLAFAGWEAVAHLAGEFRDVHRDMRRATVATVAVVLVLYTGVAFAVVGTRTYGDPAVDRVAVGEVLGTGLGFSATVAAAVLATVISLGTTNTFLASTSRLAYALGRDGWMPEALTRRDARGVPVAGVLTVAGGGAAGLAISWAGGWGTEALVGIPASLVLVTYLAGMGAGVRLLQGRARAHAATALVLTAAIAPFAAKYIAVPAVVAAVAMAFRRKTGIRPVAKADEGHR